MRLFLVTFIATLMAVPAHATDWFYANADGDVIEVRPDGWSLNIGGMRGWRTGDVVVGLRDGESVLSIEALADVAWAEPLHAERGLYVVHAQAGVDEIGLSNSLFERDDVRFSHPDFELFVQPHTVNDPLFDKAWHLQNSGLFPDSVAGNDLGAVDAWTLATGKGVVIAIIDSGVDHAHPDLDLVQGYDTVDNDDLADPVAGSNGYGHGTAMAGIAAAKGDNGVGTVGVAYDARIMPIRIGFGGEGSLSQSYAGMKYAVENGADVLSNSWGQAYGCDPLPNIGLYVEAIDLAETQGRGGLGALWAQSLGNEGCDASQYRYHSNPTLISVGAVTDLDRLVKYSNYGATMEIVGYGGGDGRPSLITTDISGDLGYSKAGDGLYWSGGSGTSSACATIAGVLALILEANPRITAAQARQVLYDTANKPSWGDANWSVDGRSERYGYGRADAWAAVQAVYNEVPSVRLVGPEGEVPLDRLRLTWAGEDGDGERLTYRVQVWLEGAEDFVVDEELDAEEIGLQGQLAEGTYRWQVSVADGWGDGEPSSEGGFRVVPVPEPVRSCSVVSPVYLWWMVPGMLLLVRRRRG